jgi:hypothetical protein
MEDERIEFSWWWVVALGFVLGLAAGAVAF